MLSPVRNLIAASFVVCALLYGSAGLASQLQWNPAQVYGTAWSPALGAWLPRIGESFDPWSEGLTSWSVSDDFFVCSRGPLAAPTPFHSFYFAGRGCPLLKNGTYFVYGNAGPPKGHVVYDRPRRTVLYEEGCCAWKSFTLSSGIGPPPKAVQNADLSAVHTARGIALGMTEAQVTKVYGNAVLHKEPHVSGVVMLSYTSLKLKPSASGNKCGQFQNFAFRDGRLIYIELTAGC